MFSVYASPVGDFITSHQIQYHQYADDLQLYTAFHTRQSYDFQELTACVSDVARWFLENNLLLNPTKTEAVLFGTDQRLSSINHCSGVDVVGLIVEFTDALKLLSVTLDSSLSFDRHITEVCRSCHFHIRALRHIRPLLTHDAAISVANSIVSSRLDYCNSLLYNTSERNLNKLQRIQNTLARVTCQSPRSSSASSLRKSLHWLPVRQRIIYKTSLITYKTLKTGQPAYLRDLLHHYLPTRTLRSSSQLLLHQPATKTNFQSKAFSIITPALWNSMSLVTKCSATITTFKAHLKTELFSAAYDTV